ncbi:hypothetical protein [Zooshikella ganghwensis]|uniref:hypothetical protein n=1 Tax=Zooshikella ganghwensis TaxID=202772 RepID=UPI00041E07C6|nr:hypothetical protein [Zooshikella ganghwensis]
MKKLMTDDIDRLFTTNLTDVIREMAESSSSHCQIKIFDDDGKPEFAVVLLAEHVPEYLEVLEKKSTEFKQK